MAWWNPRDWFNKKNAPGGSKPSVWVRLDPEAPHQGLDHYQESVENPWKHGMCVLGVTPDEARSNLVGKVLDWALLTRAQLEDLERKGWFSLLYEDLQRMFR